MKVKLTFLKLWLSLIVVSGLTVTSHAQSLSYNRDLGRNILSVVKADIKKNYYDPAYHGLDLDAHFKAADEKIQKAQNLNEILSIIAGAVTEFNDSHTMFIPPRRATRIEHGWQLSMIGDKAYVVAVEPGSDAAMKGLEPGDRVLNVERMTVTRKNLSTLQYIFYVLAPRPAMHLFIEKPTGERRELTIEGRVHEGKVITNLQTSMASDRNDLIREFETNRRLYRHRLYDFDDVTLWRMPAFDLEQSQIDEIMDRVRKHKALVLDLRGNPGGAENCLLALVGYLFDHDVTLGEMHRRNETKPLIAKSKGSRAFAGKIVVLIDSESASSAELLAKTIQREHRGAVIGDQSSGQVMRARLFDHEMGQNLLFSYGMSVTDADIVDAAGKSLENVGVTPDEVVLPMPADLAASRDPVLAHAAQLAGLALTPEKAGTLFPVEWRK